MVEDKSVFTLNMVFSVLDVYADCCSMLQQDKLKKIIFN